MGTLIGNVLGLFLTLCAALVGFVSLQASATAFVALAYALWLLVLLVNFYSGRAVSSNFTELLTAEELRTFRRYALHIRVPAVSDIFSAAVNLMRIFGFIWAALCLWYGHYIPAAASCAFFFVSSGLIVRTQPLLYIGRAVQSGNVIATVESGVLHSVKAGHSAYLTGLSDDLAGYDESPEEVKLTVEQARRFLADEAGPSRRIVEPQVVARARETEKTVYSVRVDGQKPDQLALLLITNVLGFELGSGSYHVYRGVLSMVGKDMLEVWHSAQKVMEERGYATAQEIAEDNRWIDRQIKNAG